MTLHTLGRRLAAALLLAAAASGAAHAGKNIVLIYNGEAIANTEPAPSSAAFTSWCQPACAPSVKLPMFDPGSGKLRGEILVWTMPFQSLDGLSFCFSEYIVFKLAEGEVHTASHPAGVCGGTIHPLLKPATHVAGVVVAGGGDGVVVDGTGMYRAARGTYTDRVFVELGATNYYDQLIFIISLDR
jgi:hypothetical protein